MPLLAQQLDLTTALVFLLAVTTMDGIIALLIWNAHRRMTGLTMTAAGLMSFGIAVWMVPATSLVLVTLRNSLFNLSQAMAAEGMAEFLDKPRLRWLPPAVLVFSLIFWPAAQLRIPETESPQIRTIVSSLISILLIARMFQLMLRDRGRTLLLRAVTLACLCALVATVGTRLYTAANGPWTDATFYSPSQAWFYFLICIEENFLFFCLLTMVGERLSRDLRVRNRDLSAEVEQRARLQTEISGALAKQVRLQEERRQFLHILGHEIDTPLAVIDRSAEMIQSAPETSAPRLENIRSAVRRLSWLTSGLLAVERACLENPRLETLDANELVHEAVDMVEELAPSIDLSLCDSPALFSVDRDMILMAMTNVLSNAAKFSPDGQAVAVTLRDDGNMLVFSVADRGIGFPEAELQAIGQCFFRASNARSIPGNGLGLYIVSLILGRHGGSVAAENRPHGGAVVSLRLPRRIIS